MSQLEEYFAIFRTNIIGSNKPFTTPFGQKQIRYADWIASGRLYLPIENKIMKEFGPFVGNTHTETSETGSLMTAAYHWSHELIKKHVNAGPDDKIITAGFGMTAVINKFQRILGLKHPSQDVNKVTEDKPVVFITHMEHHSNHTSWYETNCDVVVLPPDKDLLVDPNLLEWELQKYQNRSFKIGSFTACSNVTGVHTPIHELAKIMHKHGGVVFIDFAASAPYETINMHPEDTREKLDAVMFSPHKFLGGPGSSGVLVFDATMYKNEVPDNPGGGTVDWTNPWGKYKYVEDIEVREDGGTPGFLQSIKTALAIQLKEQMGVKNIKKRESELLKLAFSELDKIQEVKILADKQRDRLGVISFYIEDVHYNLLVQLLNDIYGFQVRGGCACAGTYGHFLLKVSYEKSQEITDKISHGDLSVKPGWVRWSLHPTMTNKDITDFTDALKHIVSHIRELKEQYNYIPRQNHFKHKTYREDPNQLPKLFQLTQTRL